MIVLDLLLSVFRFGLALRDLTVLYLLPKRVTENSMVGFLIHDRDGTDIARWFPIVRYLPAASQEWFRWWIWPVRTTKIRTSLTTPEGKIINGWLLAIMPTAEMMVRDLRKTKKKIDLLFRLADKLGISVVGLGAYSASVTRLGAKISGRDGEECAKPTTGHALTAAVIVGHVEKLALRLNIDLESKCLGILGAGSIGSTCARLLAKEFGKIVIVDIAKGVREDLARELRQMGRFVVASDDLGTLKSADFVIVATTATGLILKEEHLRQGAVVFDDSQPRNLSEETSRKSRVVVIDGGVTRNMHVSSGMDFGLCTHEDVWGCLGEAILIAALGGQQDLCTVGLPKPETVRRLGNEAPDQGFELVFRSFCRPLPVEAIMDCLNNGSST